jgi:hypothetical protein
MGRLLLQADRAPRFQKARGQWPSRNCGPSAGPDDWADAWFLDSPSVAQWLTSWLDGTGWWEEAVMMAEDGPQPTPWLDAERRLAASG